MGKIGKKAFHASTFGIFKKPKTPGQTPEELELEERQRSELDKLTRETNIRLKAIKRGKAGRRTLLGSGSELGVDGLGGVGVRGGPSRASRARGGGPRATGGGGARAKTSGGILGRSR